MIAAQEVMPLTGVLPILVALGLSAATFYRRRRPQPAPSARPKPDRTLSDPERTAVLDVLHSDAFVDKSPAEVFATLLDEGTYLCSPRTMYRILSDNDEVRERRNQLRHPEYKKPELIATAPNQVWSWDITKFRTFIKFKYLYLYVIIDIFSRYVVGWVLADHENAGFAKRLISETCHKHDVAPGALTLHNDRGAPMTAHTFTQLLASLSVTPSLSRPHVSDDNPFSESHFKTMKYAPSFPERFGVMEDGLKFCRPFFTWYNEHHHHSGIAHLTPHDVHYGNAPQRLGDRHKTMMAAYNANPTRFINGPPMLQTLPQAVYINPPTQGSDISETTLTTVVANSLDLVSQSA